MIIAAPGVGSGAVCGGVRWEWVGGGREEREALVRIFYPIAIANFFSKETL